MNKKPFIILIVLLVLLGVTYYVMGYTKKDNTKKNNEVNNVEKKPDEKKENKSNTNNETPSIDKTVSIVSLDKYEEAGSYLVNKQTKDKYILLPMNDDDEGNIFVIMPESYNGPMGIYNRNNGYIIEPKYNDVACTGHSGEDYYTCSGSNTTLLDFSKLISLETGNVIIEADKINELSNGNFIAIKDNKSILYTSEGKQLLKKDYIGYNSTLGYITLSANNVFVFTESMKQVDLNESIINKVYVLETDENSMWVDGDLILRVNLQNNNYFKYTEDKYKGVKTVLITNPCSEEINISTYVLSNGKAEKINIYDYLDSEDTGNYDEGLDLYCH